MGQDQMELGIRLHSKPIYDDKYIKTKVSSFNEW